MAKKGIGSSSNGNETTESRSRKTLAFALNILFWLIFIGTFVLNSQENRNKVEPHEVFTEILDDATQEVEITDEP